MHKIGHSFRVLLLALVLLLSVHLPSSGQQAVVEGDTIAPFPYTDINLFGLFEKDEILEVSLRFDISRFTRKKSDEEDMDALLTYRFGNLDSVNKVVKLRARGNYRLRTCSFPPIRLDFDKASFGFADLDSLGNVKLVTHCEDSDTYRNYLMREYLVYRLYNIVTDNSFRVRFLRINYIDTGRRGLNSVQYAFLIEPLDRVLYRTNSVEIEDVVVKFENVERSLMDRISLFQFMIGNSDWYLPMIHNFKIIKPLDKATPDVVPVPYDFDYSGFVNTHYAMPREDLNLEKITDRVYLGPCRSEEELRIVLDEFMAYREAFINEIRNFEYLDRVIRRELVSYVESFYDLYKRDILLKRILQECVSK